MIDNEFQNKTDEELLGIKRREENTNIPTSQYQRASRELELRDREKNINIPWYKDWWMVYVVYPLFGVLVGVVITMLLKN